VHCAALLCTYPAEAKSEAFARVVDDNYLGQDVGCAGGPDEWLGIDVVMCRVQIDGECQFCDAGEAVAWVRFSVMSRKNRSTMFNHDALIGVKNMMKRGCRASHFRTSGCLCVA